MQRGRYSIASTMLVLFLTVMAWSTYRLEASPAAGRGAKAAAGKRVSRTVRAGVVGPRAILPTGPGVLNVQVNDPSTDLPEQTTQRDPTVASSGSTVVVAYMDTGDGGTGGGNNLTGVSVSDDSGFSFEDLGPLEDLGGGTTFGQPMVASDSQGTFYIATPWIAANGELRIGLFNSSDGRNWNGPVNVSSGANNTNQQSRPWLAVDTTGGSRDGTIYCTWTSDEAAGPAVKYSLSSDQGATFANSVTLSTLGIGSRVAVGKDGPNGAPVFAAWHELPSGTNPVSSIRVARSDDGTSFAAPRTISGLRPMGRAVPGSIFRALNGDIFVNHYPSIAADQSDGPLGGSVYVAFASGGVRGDADIFISRSPNGGQNWSVPVSVGRTTNDQFFPSVCVTDDGRVHVLYYDRSRDPLNFAIEAVLATSIDGGATWTETVVTPGSFLPTYTNPQFDSFWRTFEMGEFTHTAAAGNSPLVVWADNRNSVNSAAWGVRTDADVYFADGTEADDAEGPRARVLIEHPNPSDLIVTVGTGPIDQPDFQVSVATRQLVGRTSSVGNPYTIATDVDISGGQAFLPPSRGQLWWVKAEDQVSGNAGRIAAAQLVLPEEIWTSDDTPVAISDGFEPAFAFIGPPNEPPSVDAGPDFYAFEDEDVFLFVETSDEDDDPLTIQWKQTKGTPVTLDDATIVDPLFTAPYVPVSDVLEFEVSVSDGFNPPVTDTVAVEIVAAIPATVTGRVLDEDGFGVAGATVVVVRTDGQQSTTQFSDGNGNFVVNDVRVGENTVIVSRRGYEPELIDDFYFSGETVDLGDIFLDILAAEITGRVVQSDGRPLPGATVDLLNATGDVLASTRTDGAGEYLLDDIDRFKIEEGRAVRVTRAGVPEWLRSDIELFEGEVNEVDFRYGAVDVRLVPKGKKLKKALAGTRIQVAVGNNVLGQIVLQKNTRTVRFTNLPAVQVRITAGSTQVQGGPADVTVSEGPRPTKVKLILQPFQF